MANNREISQFAGLVTVNDTTNQVSLGSSLVLSGEGKLGIGTDNPTVKLDVRGGNIQQYNENASGGTGLILHNYAAGGGGNTLPYSFIRAKSNPIRNAGEIRFGRDSAYGSAAEADSHISFWTAKDDTNTERLRITSSGYVGIGSDNPGNNLTVSQNQTGNTTIAVANLNTSSGTYSSYYALAGSVVGQIYVDGQGDDGLQGLTLRTTSNHGLRLGTNNTERLRITSNGSIKQTRPYYFLAGQYVLADNNWQTIGAWDGGGNLSGAGVALIMASQHAGATNSKSGFWKQTIFYNGTLGTLSTVTVDSNLSLSTRIDGGNFQVKAYDSGTGLTTVVRLAIIFNDSRIHLFG